MEKEEGLTLKQRLIQRLRRGERLSPEERRESHELAIWGALRNLWTCKEVLEYAKLPKDREKALKDIKAWEEILEKRKSRK